MYGIYAYINPPNHPNVGIYGIHGASGFTQSKSVCVQQVLQTSQNGLTRVGHRSSTQLTNQKTTAVQTRCTKRAVQAEGAVCLCQEDVLTCLDTTGPKGEL